MQTAVQFIEEKLDNLLELYTSEWEKVNEVLDQAKEMFKQQIIDATCLNDYVNEDDREIGERYYNETYGSKGSDEIGTMTPENHVDVLCKAINSENPNVLEISDEKILIGLKNSWFYYEYDNGNLYSTTYTDGWVNAIKWYREQLKKK